MATLPFTLHPWSEATIKQQRRRILCASVISIGKGLSLNSVVLVRYSQLLATFSTTCCQYSATVSCSHSLTETVLVSSLSVRGLKCSLHCYI
jgi:hypothetical protein